MLLFVYRQHKSNNYRNMKQFFITSLLALLLAGAAASAQVPSFRVAVQGGYGYRLGKMAETGQAVVDQHNQKLKWGFTYGADATWYFSDSFGLGLKFNDIHSKAEDAVTVTYNDGSAAKSGIYRDVVDLRFMGVMASSRLVLGDGRWIWMMGYGAGYLSYVDNGRVIDVMSIKGGTLGACLETGIDFRLMNNLYLGASVNAIGGKLSSYQYTEGGKTETIKLDKDELEGLYHLTASVGLRFYL